MKLLKSAILSLLIVLPLFALAQSDPGVRPYNLLNPPAISNGTDLSLGYLEDIFGVVDGVLHGSGSQIMGQMFAVFNAAALSLGVIIMLYTTILSIANTAGEGEFLGRKFSSIWIPFRTSLGVILLIPKASGYSLIQIFMMWAIVQGIGAADSIWDTALRYLKGGGVIVQQSFAPQGNIAAQAKDVLRSQVCMYGLESALNQARNDAAVSGKNLPSVPDFSSTINPLDERTCPLPTKPNDPRTCIIRFPGKFPGSAAVPNQFDALTGICGQVQFDMGSVPANFASDASKSGVSQQEIEYLKTTFTKAPAIALQQFLNDMGLAARQIVNTEITPKFKGINIEMFQPKDTYAGVTNRIFLQGAVDYQGLISSTNATKFVQNMYQDKWMKQSSAQGWIMAGTYYQNLINANRAVKSIKITNVPIPSSYTQLKNCLIGGKDCPSYSGPAVGIAANNIMPGTKASSYAGTLSDFITNSRNLPGSKAFDEFVKNAPTTDPNYGGREEGRLVHSDVVSKQLGGYIKTVLVPIVGPLVSIAVDFSHLAKAQQNGVNPIVVLADIGSMLMGLVVQIYIIGTAVIAATTAGLASIPFMAMGTVPVAVITFLSSFIWSFTVVLFTNGAIYAYYIPLIPFILFLFGAIGWMMQVIEAMVAAPIVALGVTHPEGQEILGKADPAVLLLINVFLRPSMMIIGLIASIILSYVAVWLLNQGFFRVFFAAATNNVSGFGLYFFILPALLTIYTLLIVAVLNQVFDIINQIPDRVMTWIGGQDMGIGQRARQAEGEVKGGYQQVMTATGQGMKKGAEDAGEQIGEEAKKSGESDQAQSKGDKKDDDGGPGGKGGPGQGGPGPDQGGGPEGGPGGPEGGPPPGSGAVVGVPA